MNNKKSIVFLLIISTYLSCKNLEKYSDKMKFEDSRSGFYKVYKIDSIKNYYLIYAIRKDTLYKIVSKKSTSENCNPIRVNQKYPFILHSRLAARASGQIKILPGLVNCFSYDDDTIICFEDSIYDLHSADNVKGLCFLK